MTPWQLQDEFFRATKEFYNFHSSFRIGKLFGAEYGWRRFGLALNACLGTAGARYSADHVKNSYYYYLKHLA